MLDDENVDIVEDEIGNSGGGCVTASNEASNAEGAKVRGTSLFGCGGFQISFVRKPVEETAAPPPVVALF